jgi:DNA-binding transcriptional regulator YhcF (GntR family)
MNDSAIIDNLKRYLKTTLKIELETTPWNGAERLPFIFRNNYTFYTTNILNHPYLLTVAKKNKKQAPAIINKQISLISEKWGSDVIYVDESVSSYNRQRLIDLNVPFIIPGNQMFLPMVGIDLREHFKSIRSANVKKLNPSTQAVLINHLINNHQITYSQTELAIKLNYTNMTINRAFYELESSELAAILTQGREKTLHFEDSKMELWEKAKRFLRSPVKRKLIVESKNFRQHFLKAGQTALAHYSMISEPKHQIFAISGEQSKIAENFEEIEYIDENSIELEIWTYSPHLFADNGFVDRISLYCSMMDNKDERIESALEEMMKKIKW